MEFDDFIKEGLRACNAGDYSRAEQMFRSATIAAGGRGPEAIVNSLKHLAVACAEQGKYDDAVASLERAIDIMVRTGAEETSETGIMLADLAWIHVKRRDFVQAKGYYQRALGILRRSLGPGHAQTAGVISNLGLISELEGDSVGAEDSYKRTIEILEKLPEARYPDFAKALGNLAQLYMQERRYAEAEPLLRRALGIVKSAGRENSDMWRSLSAKLNTTVSERAKVDSP
jgi:tetratricopeptide (TPR) repeat protein